MPASATSLAIAPAYSNLKGLLRQVSALAEIEGILGYDEQCFMPPGAAAARAAQKAALAKVRHSLATGDSMRAAIDGVRGRIDELPDDERMRANVRDAVADFDKEARKSPELAEAEARLESEAFGAWQAARAVSDFSLFAPKLKEMFDLKKEVMYLMIVPLSPLLMLLLSLSKTRAHSSFPIQKEGVCRCCPPPAARATHCICLEVARRPTLPIHICPSFSTPSQVARVTRPTVAEPYDGALDAFESGMTAHRLDALFKELREGLLPLLCAITAKQRTEPDIDAPHPALLPGKEWDVDKQEALAKEVAAELGYGKGRGRFLLRHMAQHNLRNPRRFAPAELGYGEEPPIR
jgi:Zn-dependent M32 family carboxypeptidase